MDGTVGGVYSSNTKNSTESMLQSVWICLVFHARFHADGKTIEMYREHNNIVTNIFKWQ